MKDCKISVAMTTYNGEKFIIEQLESIRIQTRLPDEVVICDDGSEDRTVQLIDDYIHAHRLTNWRLVSNDTNLGWRSNFFKAASLVSGDVVFFADQDDIWDSRKIETMSDLLISHKAGCVYCSSNIVDGQGRLLRRSEPTGRIRRIKCKKSFIYHVTLGCRSCFSKSVIARYLNFGHDDLGHDSQCGWFALLYEGLVVVDLPLINYRIHGSNNSGIRENRTFGSSNLSTRISVLERSLYWLTDFRDKGLLPDKQTLLGSLIRMVSDRIAYLKGERNARFISLVRYAPYYPSFSAFVGDFSYRHKLNERMGRVRQALSKKPHK